MCSLSVSGPPEEENGALLSEEGGLGGARSCRTEASGVRKSALAAVLAPLALVACLCVAATRGGGPGRWSRAVAPPSSPPPARRGVEDGEDRLLLGPTAAVLVELLPWHVARDRAARTVARMTEDEAGSLLVGHGFLNGSSWVGTTLGVPRLGVPSLKIQDAGTGFRPIGEGTLEYGTVTQWPSMLTLASSWDVDLVRLTAGAIAREFRRKGANVLLGPGVNVHRTPYGGRNWEYISGEDPILGARLVAAYIEGVQREGVMAVVKHFAFNEQETDRNSIDTFVDERTMWELYYPPFEAAVEAGVGGVMCSYNKVFGKYACGSPMLKDHLKNRMHFQGFVMSDWWAVHSTQALEGGVDMEQPDAHFFSNASLRKKHVERRTVHEAATRVLSSIYRLRLDERESCELPCKEERSRNVRTPETLQLAERAAAAGIVLLKNEDEVLPLSSDRVGTIAVLGPASWAKDTLQTWGPGSPYSGGGSGHVPSPFVVTPLAGLRQRAAREGIKVVTGEWFSAGPAHLGPHASEVVSRRLSRARRLSSALRVAAEADVVVVVGATTATESADRNDLKLDDGIDELIELVARLKPTVVLMEVPGAVLTPWRKEVKALACLFHGGERTGEAWASMLFGDTVPAGRLPVTMPASEQGLLRPARNELAVYDEKLLTSYRSPALAAAYPFGHGLSFTSFNYTSARLETQECKGVACLRVVVRNTGRYPGAEVVQVYAEFPARAAEPRLLLRAFARTAVLQPAHEAVVGLTLSARDLSTFDTHAHRWELQHGTVRLHIGASSTDLRHTVDAALRA